MPHHQLDHDHDSYSQFVAMIYIFNLLFGNGVLALPAVFQKSGYILGSVTLVAFGMVSFMCATFLIESMANASFLENLASESDQLTSPTPKGHHHPKQCSKSPHITPTEEVDDNFMKRKLDLEETPNLFDITERTEIGYLAETFLPFHLKQFFFMSIAMYLYGDLVIYNVMLAKSSREITCLAKYDCENIENRTNSRCWEGVSLTRGDVYQLYVTLFILLQLPFTFARITKSKNVQICTIILRWVAAISMIAISLKVFLATKHHPRPSVANFNQVPRLFGVTVYSFMVHHGLPGIIAPMRDKLNRLVYQRFMYVWIAVFIFYILLATSAVFTFEFIYDILTLNFQTDKCATNGTSESNIPFFNYFIPSYPIFTLFSSYTVVAIALINNLVAIVGDDWMDRHPIIRRWCMPFVAILPPYIVSLFTEDVSRIVGYVGSYVGTIYQYLFPSILAWYSRHKIQEFFIKPKFDNQLDDRGANLIYKRIQPLGSPFNDISWIYFTFSWWMLSILITTYNHIASGK